MFPCRGCHLQEAAILFLQEKGGEDVEENVEEKEEVEMVQLEGGLQAPPVQYEGPAFPPQAGRVPQNQTPILGVCQLRDPLEQQLVEW